MELGMAVRVWKLIAHHEHPQEAFSNFCEQGLIGVGWSDIGDLAERNPTSGKEISKWIRSSYPQLGNSHLGGPSLWNFFGEMSLGDLVIVASKGKRFGVFKVTGVGASSRQEGKSTGRIG